MPCCPIPETGTPAHRLFDWLRYRAPGHSHGIGDYPDEATFFGAWKRFGGSTPSYRELLIWENEESEDSDGFEADGGTDSAADATNPITKHIKRHRRFGLDTPSPSPGPLPAYVAEYQSLREKYKKSKILPRREMPSVTIVFLEEDGQMKEWIMLPRLTRSARQKSEGQLANHFWTLESAGKNLKVKFGKNQLKSKARPSEQSSKSPSSHSNPLSKSLRTRVGRGCGIRKKANTTQGKLKNGGTQ